MLEFLGAVAGNVSACVVVWPCIGGAVRMHRVPVESVTARGFHVETTPQVQNHFFTGGWERVWAGYLRLIPGLPHHVPQTGRGHD